MNEHDPLPGQNTTTVVRHTKHNTVSADSDTMSSNPSGMDTGMNNPSTDLPFLVTQYLASFAAAPRNAGSEEEKGGANSSHHAAIDCIRKATYDIAAAFADLGAFGVTLQVRLLMTVC
jgi:hypothetical protein